MGQDHNHTADDKSKKDAVAGKMAKLFSVAFTESMGNGNGEAGSQSECGTDYK